MIALIQRVSQASVSVDGATVGQIGRGVLALVCAERNDTEAEAAALVAKLIGYRIFPDEQGRMNRSLADIDGELLAVPSSRWRRTPTAGPGRVSRRRRRPNSASDCSANSCGSRARATPASQRACSARTCRCN